MLSKLFVKTKTDVKGVVKPFYIRFRQSARLFPQPLLVYGAYLLQKHHAVLGKTATFGLYADMGWQAGLVLL